MDENMTTNVVEALDRLTAAVTEHAEVIGGQLERIANGIEAMNAQVDAQKPKTATHLVPPRR